MDFDTVTKSPRWESIGVNLGMIQVVMSPYRTGKAPERHSRMLTMKIHPFPKKGGDFKRWG
jgi:hypothetical protein